MRKQHLVIDAQLTDDGDTGVEVAFLYNGEVSYRRRWPSRSEALADAAAKRSELEREGWMMHW